MNEIKADFELDEDALVKEIGSRFPSCSSIGVMDVSLSRRDENESLYLVIFRTISKKQDVYKHKWRVCVNITGQKIL